MTTDTARAPMADGAVAPKNEEAMDQDVHHPPHGLDDTVDSTESRTDPDAQATVTDFLDFTEYLPSDIVRSLTLIGKLDQTYADLSSNVHKLTTTWSQQPSLPSEERHPSPVELRAQISENLRRAVTLRMYTCAEATRMRDNVDRHYTRAQGILSKLQAMLENFPAALEEQKSPAAVTRSPQVSRTTPRPPVQVGADGQKVRRKRVPRIVIPGEVLAPYELNFDAYSDSDESSSPEPDTPTRQTPSRFTPGPATRIKLVNKTQKAPKTPGQGGPGRPPKAVTVNMPGAGQSTPIVLQPPPENAVPGSADAPWLQLTPYELAKLRKKMKKNAVWSPSETMIARELKALGRGPEAFRAAKKKAEDEGRPFNSELPAPVAVDAESGAEVLPEGAISVNTLEDDASLSNKGMKLNEAKKLKRDAMAKQAVEEAEEGDRKWAEAARRFYMSAPSLGTPNPETPSAEGSRDRGDGTGSGSGSGNGHGQGVKTRTSSKRKRDVAETDTEKPNGSTTSETQGSKPPKRMKVETPVPPPQLTPHIREQARSITPILPPTIPQSTTPVPIPFPPPQQGPAAAAETSARASASPAAPATTALASDTSNSNTPTTVTAAAIAAATAVPTKPPAETPSVAATPAVEPGKTTRPVTPIAPPVRVVESRRETRQNAAKRQHQASPIQTQQQLPHQAPEPPAQQQPSTRPVTPAIGRAASRGSTPALELATGRRPSSRGKAMSQEPGVSLAADRPRRSSTARNTPAPEQQHQQSQKTTRGKRPAPGVVSTTSSGGNSAVGKRKAAPRKTARGQKKEKGPVEMEEVDDEGNLIPPDEARYCLCNRVSFGTMIECDNADNCKAEWFHLECVDLTDIPARTTKWYCPECRVLLNIGEKGEVSARGVKK